MNLSSLRRFLTCAPCLFLTLAGIANLASSARAAEEKPAPEVELKRFLVSPKGTYGWEQVKPGGDGLTYDFFPDGRLHIQGQDGEASMWEGKWSVSGDKLTLLNSTKKTKKTVTARVDGKELILDGVRYQRSGPQ